MGLVVLGRVAAQEKARPAPAGKIVRLDPRFDALVPRDAAIETVVDGRMWVEGPVWDRSSRSMLFSDVPANSIYRWKEANGLSLFLKPSGYTGEAPFTGREPGSNGLTFDPEGRLVFCQHGDRRVVRRERDGRLTVLADRYEGKRLNSPNDLVYDSEGNLYFTDPPFGLPAAFDDPAKELPWQGVYRLSKDARLELLIRDVRAPNGIAFSPDEKTLYISNADLSHAVWMAYDVRADGILGPGRVLFDATSWTKKGLGAPDGMKVDRRGNLFGAGPGGIHVFTPGGEHLGSFETGVPTGNCAWGGDGSVLYIAATTALRRVRLTTKGAGF
jgi:gluconolactonase